MYDWFLSAAFSDVLFDEAGTICLKKKRYFKELASIRSLHLFFYVFAYILNQLLELKSLWMTFGMALAEHSMMAASASMFFIAIDYKNKPNMKVTSQQFEHWNTSAVF